MTDGGHRTTLMVVAPRRMSPNWPWPTIDFWPRDLPTVKLAENTPPVVAFPLRTTLPLY